MDLHRSNFSLLLQGIESFLTDKVLKVDLCFHVHSNLSIFKQDSHTAVVEAVDITCDAILHILVTIVVKKDIYYSVVATCGACV